MGIPSYFAHIIKNHINIIQKLNSLNNIHNLYLDSNSIIYDCVYSLKNEYVNDTQFEELLYKNVCIVLENILLNINPSNVIIALDGVAPVAKLKQQRERRYKSFFNNKILNRFNIKNDIKWNTTAITPGTNFMTKLNDYLNNYFKHIFHKKCKPKKNINIQISGSNIPGEGEHKIFNYIRNNNNHKNETTLIYGLDADLIMLCISHLKYCDNIYLYRETPHFIKQIDSSLQPNECYLLNIHKLSIRIQQLLTDSNVENIDYDILNDYIFFCFLLGNDFMPHFPTLNIRTNGIYILQECYCNILNKNNLYLTKNNIIQWKNFRKFIEEISKMEEELFIHEYQERNKLEKKINRYNNDNLSNEEIVKNNILNIPLKNRETEHFINPNEVQWENRYYNSCLKIENNDVRLKQLCTNFLEGLEWTFIYYTKGCIDYRWKYNYNYPPLLKDLYKFIPYFETNFFKEEKNNPINDQTQLSYVLPLQYFNLIPKNNNKLKEYVNKQYDNINLSWTFCKYFWEAHLIAPDLNIDHLHSLTSK